MNGNNIPKIKNIGNKLEELQNKFVKGPKGNVSKQ
jgi:hypothetical protein